MKMNLVVVLLLGLAVTRSEELKDLGALTQYTAIPLHKGTVRADFSHFSVLGLAVREGVTNSVTFTTTNSFLFLKDFAALPSGPALLGLGAVARDGIGSAVIFYKFTIWRSDKFPTPMASTVVLMDREGFQREEASNALRRAWSELRMRNAVIPPPPELPVTKLRIRDASGKLVEATRTFVNPLPGETNEDYFQHLDDMAEHYSRTGKRRNE